MKICVLAPFHDGGLTTVSALISDMLSRKCALPVTLTHTGSNDTSMSLYLNLESKKDPTQSLTSILKMIQNDQISGEDLKDYTIKCGNKLGVLDPNNKTVSESDANKLLDSVLEAVDNELAVIDIVTELYEESTEQLLANSDFFVCVLSQSEDVLHKMEVWMTSPLWESIQKKGVMYVVNKFNRHIGALRDITNKLNLRHVKVCKISYNPLIVKYSNTGRLLDVNTEILNKSPLFFQHYNELKDIVGVITQNLGLPMNWKN